MPRLFTGLEIPGDVGFALSLKRGGLHGARWIDPSNYHITLRYIGDVDHRTAHEIARVVKAYPQVGRARLEVTEQEGKDQMTLLCEIENVAPGLLDDIAQTMRAETRLRADIQVVSPNALPNDGKVIEDKRVLGV